MITEKERQILENHIYNIAKKILKENINLLVEDEEKDDSKKSKDSSNNNIKEKRRRVVIKWLKDPIVDNAPIMKQLWNPNSDEEDSKRSYFYKCRDGELNDNGVPYQFSDEEITTLYKIKSQGSIN